MATLNFNGTSAYVKIGGTDPNDLSASLNNIPNGPTTMAALCRVDSIDVEAYDLLGLRGGDLSGSYYHGIRFGIDHGVYGDDDGIVGVLWSGVDQRFAGAGGGNFFIVVVDWGSGTAVERVHKSTLMSEAEGWDHQDSNAANGGLRAGPGVGTGRFLIGNYDGAWYQGDIALVAVWAGTRLSDAQVEELWTNKKTSDWCNNSAGTPDTLIELTSTSLTDIGGDPVTDAAIVVTAATATGADPTGWTFNGCGIADTGLAWIRA